MLRPSVLAVKCRSRPLGRERFQNSTKAKPMTLNPENEQCPEMSAELCNHMMGWVDGTNRQAAVLSACLSTRFDSEIYVDISDGGRAVVKVEEEAMPFYEEIIQYVKASQHGSDDPASARFHQITLQHVNV